MAHVRDKSAAPPQEINTRFCCLFRPKTLNKQCLIGYMAYKMDFFTKKEPQQAIFLYKN